MRGISRTYQVERPSKPTRELRDLTRYRRKIVGQVASEKNRLQKILEDANIKLSSVVSNMSGVTATKIMEAMIGGEEDIDELVKLRHGKLKVSRSEGMPFQRNPSDWQKSWPSR